MSFESDFAKIVNADEVLEFSREHGFVRRVRAFHPYRFLFTLALACMSGLSATLDSQAKNQLRPMSRSGLHKRFNAKAVAFVKHWYEVIVKRVILFLMPKVAVKILEPFHRVYIGDSSSWDLPESLRGLFAGCGGDASQANCKLLLLYEYITGSFSLKELVPGKEPDQKHAHAVVELLEAEDLVLLDAGFFSLETLRKITERGAYFVTRFVHSTSAWIDTADGELKRLDLVRYLNQCKADAVELVVTLGAQAKKRIECRLVAYRLPEEEANLRRQKLRKRQAKQKGHAAPSKDSLALAGWNIFVTNVPEELLPGFMVRTVYRLRWQIELIFKQMKSVLKIHHCTTQKEERFLCETYGKLIGAILVHVLHARASSLAWEQDGAEVSFDKLWKRVQEKSDSICRAFFKSVRSAAKDIRELIELATQRCRKNREKSNPTTLQRLQELKGDQVPVHVTWADVRASGAIAA